MFPPAESHVSESHLLGSHLLGPHVPERTCVACRRKRPQGELLRLTQHERGWAVQKCPRTGRGAYVCADSPACWQEKPLRRAFRAQAAAVSECLQARSASAPQTPEAPLPG